jgi:hypothetical protein
MDAGLVGIIAFADLVAVVVAVVIISLRQRRKRASNPARHVGERQPQRGRVFKNGTNHSNSREW